VVVAVRRLHLYEQAYGLTLQRLFASVFALWVGGVFVLLAVSLAGVHRQRRWLVSAAISFGLVCVVALNIVNPERLVVDRNIDHYEQTGKLDVDHLAGLSDDAVPALAGALPGLDPATRAAVEERMCAPGGSSPRDWLGRSRSTDLADRARADVCGR
jgi:two-component system sensor histidine kinase BaeS